MAKLKARNRTELVRLAKDLPASDNTLSGKIKLALMSDNSILENHSAVFIDGYAPNGRRNHTWGWKVKGKIKPHVTMDMFIDHYTKLGYSIIDS